MSPQIRLNSVVFPAPFGPRTARRSPCTTSRSTLCTASSPPKRRPTPRKRRVGAACSAAGAASVTASLDDRGGDDAVLHLTDLALPRQGLLHARRLRAARRRARLLEQAAERLVDVGHVPGQRDLRAVRALDDLHRPLVLDRLPV